MDVVLLIVATCLRTAIERLEGLVPAGSDLATFYIPNFVWWWSRSRWLGGWNPWVFAGYPANADPEIGTLQPLGILYHVLAPLDAAAIESVLIPSIAGVGMLVYLRAIGCGRAGSMAGALSFALGGFVAAHAPHPSIGRAAMMVPWALLAIEALDGLLLVAGLGAAVAGILLGGHPQVMAYAASLVLGYSLLLGWRGEPRRLLALGSAFIVAAAVASAAWLPASELVHASTRALGMGDRVDHWQLTVARLGTLVVPFAGGDSTGALYGTARPSDWGILETTGYPGMLALLAVIAGLPFLLRERRGRFWLTTAGLALVLGSGALGALPLLGGVRVPARFLLWWNVAIAASAAIALGRLGDARRAAQARLSETRGRLETERPAVPSRRACLTAAVLPASVILLTATLGDAVARRAAIGSAGVQSLIAPVKGRIDPLARVLVAPAFESVNWAPQAELRAIQGNSSLVPLTTALLLGQAGAADFARSETGSVGDPNLAAPSSHVLDLLRCGVILAARGRLIHNALGDAIAAAAMRGGDTPWEEIEAARLRKFYVYVNRRARPLAWLVGRVRVAPAAEILEKVRGTAAIDDFDPVREALSERPIAGMSRALAGDALPGLDGRVEVVRYAEDDFALRVESPATALLVTSELAYPGWWAAIDGEDAPIHSVNGGFRSIVVAAGTHDVRFAYAPRLGRIGLATSAVGVLALLACLFAGLTRRR